MKNILLILLLLSSMHASAKLGETPEQIGKRYGAVTDTKSGGKLEMRTYSHDGFTFVIEFLNGKSTAEYRISQNKEIPFDQAKAIGTEVSGKTNWVASTEKDIHRQFWIDGNVTLQWSEQPNGTTIVAVRSKAFQEFNDRKKTNTSL